MFVYVTYLTNVLQEGVILTIQKYGEIWERVSNFKGKMFACRKHRHEDAGVMYACVINGNDAHLFLKDLPSRTKWFLKSKN